jgi:hypothetical protein
MIEKIKAENKNPSLLIKVILIHGIVRKIIYLDLI